MLSPPLHAGNVWVLRHPILGPSVILLIKELAFRNSTKNQTRTTGNTKYACDVIKPVSLVHSHSRGPWDPLHPARVKTDHHPAETSGPAVPRAHVQMRLRSCWPAGPRGAEGVLVS